MQNLTAIKDSCNAVSDKKRIAKRRWCCYSHL